MPQQGNMRYVVGPFTFAHEDTEPIGSLTMVSPDRLGAGLTRLVFTPSAVKADKLPSIYQTDTHHISVWPIPKGSAITRIAVRVVPEGEMRMVAARDGVYSVTLPPGDWTIRPGFMGPISVYGDAR